MALQFVGETGVYLPERDAIRITALTVGAHIGCFATRSALKAIGCSPNDPPQQLVDRFEQNRLLIELAAMIKFRRSTSAKLKALHISQEDLSALEPSPRDDAANGAMVEKPSIATPRAATKSVKPRRRSTHRR